ncbi:hypothetical protein BDN70DRAFT_825252 [Pholiota conissans]|uniref:Uncharacterized protein n=1 Tax=Pholiota conissans TaxID=109636 RepID=A0A9P5ZCP9_9AGAR|nr:hypothetical protein BDN70DRAFT_825252 [Pholiota conissans]
MSYLLSRGLDPFVGAFTGVLAFYLHETHPRTARPEEERLFQLLQWKYRKYQHTRQ